MNSKIYSGSTHHARALSCHHSFKYPLYCFAIDLDELNSLDRAGILFGYNRWAVFSLHDRDYLADSSDSITQKLSKYLESKGLTKSEMRCTLITAPRFFGYVFNPVTFYVIQDKLLVVHAAIAEVNNTFGEKHLYFMQPDKPASLPVRFTFPKEFFVSPFFDVTGNYTVSLLALNDKLNFQIELKHGEKPVLFADITGRAKTIDKRSLFFTMLRYPVTAFLTMIRIEYQAFKLHFQRGLAPFIKPPPTSKNTIRANPNWIHKLKIFILDRVRLGGRKSST